MIEGVQITECIEIMALPWEQIVLMGTLIVLVGFIFLACVRAHDNCLRKREYRKVQKFRVAIAISSTIAMILILETICISAFVTVPTGKYQYKATVGGVVNVDAIYENYEVVEVNGSTWTLKEKETAE